MLNKDNLQTNLFPQYLLSFRSPFCSLYYYIFNHIDISYRRYYRQVVNIKEIAKYIQLVLMDRFTVVDMRDNYLIGFESK